MEATRTAKRPLLTATTIAALAVRGWFALRYFDAPGDGPGRAAIAYAWGRAPYLPICGAWPPGHMILAGLWSWIVPAPLWFARLLNVGLGALTVAIAARIAETTWDRRTAAWTAVVLAFFPLHVELSASGQTEPAFLCALVAGWWLLLRQECAVDGRARLALLVAAGLAVTAAEAIRYEGWLFACVLLAWAMARTRRRSERALFAALVLAFPLAWTLGNAHCGDAFVGFRAALSEPEAAGGYTARLAALHLARLAGGELGPLLALLAVAGVALETSAVLRRRAGAERVLAVAMLALAWAFLERFTMTRGPSAWNRYALAALALAVPFAFVPLRRIASRPRAAAVAAALAATSLVLPLATGRRAVWIRPRAPEETAALADWLRADTKRVESFILATPVGWELTFLPLYEPATFTRLFTVSNWIPDADLATAVANARRRGEFLLVTQAGDETDLARIEHTAGVSLVTTAPVFTTGPLRVYRVTFPDVGR